VKNSAPNCDANEAALRRAAAGFRDLRQLYYYSLGKMRHDPAYPFTARILREATGPILDVGCGAGLLAAYLREQGLGQPLLGVEPDAAKINLAHDRIRPRYEGLDFAVGRAESLPEFSGQVVALDIMHYFSDEDQVKVLANLAARVGPGCRLVLRTTLRESHWRYRATMIEEAFVRGTGWIIGGAWNFPRRETIASALQASGLRFVALPMWGGTPFNSWLFLARRPEG